MTTSKMISQVHLCLAHGLKKITNKFTGEYWSSIIHIKVTPDAKLAMPVLLFLSDIHTRL